MKPLLALYITSLILLSNFSWADETKNMNPTEFINSYEKVLASQKWERVEPLIHNDCTVTFSSGVSHQGKKAVQKAFQKNFDLIKNEKYKITNIHWVISSKQVAVFTYSYSWSGLIGGKPASGFGSGTSTLIRVDKSWKLVAEHLGPKPTKMQNESQ